MAKIYMLISFVLVAMVASNAQTTVTITADRDNTMFSENPNNSNGAGENFFAGRTNNGSLRRGLIRFNLSSIPSAATVTAVSIRFTCNKLAANAAGIQLHRLNADWGQGTSDAGGQEGSGISATTNDATWSNRFHPSTSWTTAGGSFNATASATVSSVGSGNLTITGGTLIADVQSFVTTASGNFGWLVRGTNESLNATALRFGSIENPTVNSRPQITVTYSVVAPVLLKRFYGSLKGAEAVLQWQTATEVNNDFFEVQHSTNAERFNTVGRVQGVGNSNTLQQYGFVHSDVTAPRNYYRLVQHDKDGTIHYSSVILLTKDKKAGLQVTPNPAEDIIRLKAPFITEGLRFVIVSSDGKTVMNGTLTEPQVDIRQLARGMYQLLVFQPDGEKTQTRFVKN